METKLEISHSRSSGSARGDMWDLSPCDCCIPEEEMKGAGEHVPNPSSEKNEVKEEEQSRGWEAMMRKESGHLYSSIF